MSDYYVSMTNQIGQATLTMYPSKERFDEWYAGTMNDGTGDPIKVAYPKINYQGTDKDECRRINHEQAMAFYSLPKAVLISTLAEFGRLEEAIEMYQNSIK